MGQVIAHVAINPAGASGGTSAAIDTTGADLIIFAAVQDFAAAFTVSDNQGNTYTDTAMGISTGNGDAKTALFVCFSPTTSATHTFTIGGGTFHQAANILAVRSGLSLDVTATSTNNTASTTIAPGSVTPSSSPAMVISIVGASGAPGGSFSIDSGMTISDQNGGANHYFVALAYKFQSSAAAISPTWTASGSCSMGATASTFAMNEDTAVAVAITETGDTVAASLNSTFNTAVAITESPDVIDGALSTTVVIESIAITESPDAFFANLGAPYNITIAIGSEDADTVAIVLENSGSWANCTPVDTAWTDCTDPATTWANCTNPTTDWTVN